MVSGEQQVQVYSAPSGLTAKQIFDRSVWPTDYKMEPVRAERLRVGQIILAAVPGGGILVGHVRATPTGEPFFLTIGKSVTGALRFSEGRWVCDGIQAHRG